jgi:DNA-binding GntR family transcriptional regulator
LAVKTIGQPERSGLVKRPARLGDEVYNAIYAQLMSHKIAPGSRISIDNLVREMGVSQTPIREALSRLEAQGLVVKTHLIGYSAASQMDMGRLKQLYDLRLLLEPYAAEHAAINMTDEGVAQLEAIDQSMRGVPNPGLRASYGEFAQNDGQFHDLIASYSGNELVQDTLARLHTHVHLFRLFYHATATTDANTEHEDIIAAISRRDGKAAHDAMYFHIEQSRNRFLGT